MSIPMHRLALVLALGLTACAEHAPAWYGLTDEYSEDSTGLATSFPATTGAGATTEDPAGSGEPTTGGAADTSTGDLGSTSTGAPIDEPPQVFAFAVVNPAQPDMPGQIFEAGEVQLDLEVSEDVVAVDLSHGDTFVATLPVAAFPYTFDITSQAACDGSQNFTAVVRDAGGQTDMRSADLYCQLPAPGLKFKNDAVIAATITDKGFTAAGWCRHKPDGAIRQVCVQEFDADGLPVGIFAEPSPSQAEARAVALDRERKLVVGGFSTKPGQTDAWVFASLGADKPLAWSQTYDASGWDFASGVACDLWGHCTWVGATAKDGKLTLVVSRRNP